MPAVSVGIPIRRSDPPALRRASDTTSWLRLERADAEVVYERGRDAVVGVLLVLSAQNERVQARVERLTARVARQDERIAQLERRLNRSSRNSS